MKRWNVKVGLGLLLLLLLVVTGCAGSSDGDRAVFGGDETIEAGEVVDGDLAVFGGNVEVEEGARIQGDVAVFGGNLDLYGQVSGDVAVFGGSIHRVSDSVEGDINVMGGSSELLDAPSGGATPPVEPDTEETAPVGEDERDRDFRDGDFRPGFRESPAGGLFGLIAAIIGTALRTLVFGALGLGLALFMPDHVRRVGRAAGEAPAASIGVGCLSMPALVVVGIVAAVTIIGIPIALLLPLLAAAAGILGWVGLGYFLGDRLLRGADIRSPRLPAAAAIGAGGMVLASSVADVIPFFGWLLFPVLAFWGLGATILTKGGTQPYPARARVAGPVPPPTFDPLDDIAPAPRRAPSRNDLFADLAADLGVDERDLRGETPTRPKDETPPPL